MVYYTLLYAVYYPVYVCRRLTSYVCADRRWARSVRLDAREARLSYLFIIGRHIPAKARKSKLTFSFPPDIVCPLLNRYFLTALSISISNDLVSRCEEWRGISSKIVAF